MVPFGRTAHSSLVTNDTSAWYLTVGLACSRHLCRIHWRVAAGAPVCMRWRILQLQVEIAPLQNGACRCNVPEFPGQWRAHRGLSWKSKGTAVARDVGRYSDRAIATNTIHRGHWTVGRDHITHQTLLVPVVLLSVSSATSRLTPPRPMHRCSAKRSALCLGISAEQ